MGGVTAKHNFYYISLRFTFAPKPVNRRALENIVPSSCYKMHEKSFIHYFQFREITLKFNQLNFKVITLLCFKKIVEFFFQSESHELTENMDARIGL